MKKLTPALLTMLMLGVVGLLVVGYVAKTMLARTDAPPAETILNVPMALADIAPGTVITEAHLAIGRLRESNSVPETVRSDRVLLGRVVKTPIQAARPILTTDLYPPGEYPELQLEPGMRAVSVTLMNNTAIAEGLVRPGKYVDVHFTPAGYRDQEQTGGLTMTLFKGVKVLRTGGVAGSVTLELAKEQANILLQAKDKGEIELTYTPEGKGDGGVAISSKDRATLDEILGLKVPFVTQVYYGGRNSQNSFVNGHAVIGDNGFDDRGQAPVTTPGAGQSNVETPPAGSPRASVDAGVRN